MIPAALSVLLCINDCKHFQQHTQDFQTKISFIAMQAAIAQPILFS